MVHDITVGIITHPPRIRNGLLVRALDSVWGQTRLPEAITVRVDRKREGAPIMRQRLLEGVRTTWLAWLDSDDEFYPHHLATLLMAAVSEKADLVYSWYDVIGGSDPLPGEAEDWKPGLPTTITTLVRTELALEAGGYYDPNQDLQTAIVTGEDDRFVERAHAAGGKIHHVIGNRTWAWHHDSGNTSGLPRRWK